MIYLFTYDEIKRLDQERRARSMAFYERSRRRKTPVSVSQREPGTSELIEVVFGAQCEHTEPIGA